jgi:hypothetical protein
VLRACVQYGDRQGRGRGDVPSAESAGTLTSSRCRGCDRREPAAMLDVPFEILRMDVRAVEAAAPLFELRMPG